MTNIEMEWTEKGALVRSTIPLCCPTCHAMVPANVEHRCGDRILPTPKPKKRAKRGGVAA